MGLMLFLGSADARRLFSLALQAHRGLHGAQLHAYL